MAFNPVTGNYDPDMSDFSSWFQPQQQPQQQGMNYIYGNTDTSQQPGMIGDGTVPQAPAYPTPDPRQSPSGIPGDVNSTPGGPMDPNSPYFQQWLLAHSGDPQATTPTPVGTVTTGTNKPGGVDFSSPTTVPALTTASLPQPVVGTGNPGNDRNNPPGPGYFWSGTANHWVDPTYQHDATGRLLSPEEQAFWKGEDTTRAQNTAAGMPYTLPTNPTIPGAAPAQTTAAPAAQPATAAASPYDYSKQGSVPYYAFDKNVYADTNAQQSFLELQGVMDQDRLQKAQQLYGWQKAVDGTTTDANAVYAKAIEMAKADPNSDYSIVKVAMPDGSVGYGVLKRENGGGNVAAMQAAQSARGFISPAVAIARAQAQAAAQLHGGGGGGGRPNYPAQQRSVSSLPVPSNYDIAKSMIDKGLDPAHTTIDNTPYKVDVNPTNPTNPAGHSPTIGQVITVNGQVMQFNGVQWVPLDGPGGRVPLPQRG